MKRKDIYTLVAAFLFAFVVMVGNTAVAHDGPDRCPPSECKPAPRAIV